MRAQRERGASLVEALIAFLVLSLGMLGVMRLQTHLQRHADIARQKSEALHLAQEAMEGLRARPGELEPEETHDADAGSVLASHTVYRLERALGHRDGDRFSSASIAVKWTDRSGDPHNVQLQSAIGSVPAGLSGALAVQARRERFATIDSRAPSIPRQAHPLGDGRSVLKPSGSTMAFVFDDITGQLAARCAGLDADLSSSGVSAQSLAQCETVHGHLLSGWVRFAPGAAGSGPGTLPLSIVVELASDAAESMPCITEPRAGALAYYCAIAPAGPWSGRSRIVPQGWSLGTEAGQYQVCRFSVDTDGSGAIDRPAEHPEHYHDVDTPLMQQNFLVIPGHRACADMEAITAHHQP